MNQIRTVRDRSPTVPLEVMVLVFPRPRRSLWICERYTLDYFPNTSATSEAPKPFPATQASPGTWPHAGRNLHLPMARGSPAALPFSLHHSPAILHLLSGSRPVSLRPVIGRWHLRLGTRTL